MTNDLEIDLRRAFARSAELAPQHRPEWVPQPPSVTVRDRMPRSQRPTRVVVGLLSAAALVGVVAVAALIRTAPPSGAVPPFQPPGINFAIASTAALAPSTPFVVEPNSVRSIAVPNHPTLSLYVAAQHLNGHVRQYRCLEAQGDGAGCAPEWTWDSPDVGQFSTVDNQVGTFDLFTWANVPATAAFVVWMDGPTTYWQRPVDGVAAFPVTDHKVVPGVAIAYDVSGHELERAGSGVPAPTAVDPDGGLRSNLKPVADQELQQLADTTINACLGDSTGRTWNDCLAIADSAVQARFVELGGSLVPVADLPVCTPGFTESTESGRPSCMRTSITPDPTVATVPA